MENSERATVKKHTGAFWCFPYAFFAHRQIGRLPYANSATGKGAQETFFLVNQQKIPKTY